MTDNWIPNEPQAVTQPAPKPTPDLVPGAENPPLRVLLDNAIAVDERLYGAGKGPYSAR